MTAEERAAFINSQVACANAEIAAMQAHDRHLSAIGCDGGFYAEEAYLAVPDKYGLGHNAVLAFLRNDGSFS